MYVCFLYWDQAVSVILNGSCCRMSSYQNTYIDVLSYVSNMRNLSSLSSLDSQCLPATHPRAKYIHMELCVYIYCTCRSRVSAACLSRTVWKCHTLTQHTRTYNAHMQSLGLSSLLEPHRVKLSHIAPAGQQAQLAIQDVVPKTEALNVLAEPLVPVSELCRYVSSLYMCEYAVYVICISVHMF